VLGFISNAWLDHIPADECVVAGRLVPTIDVVDAPFGAVNKGDDKLFTGENMGRLI